MPPAATPTRAPAPAAPATPAPAPTATAAPATPAPAPTATAAPAPPVIPAATPAPATEAAERARRYHEAQSHELVRDLIKRFDADIVARELLDDQS
ncbi:MAG TPA: hypothetical protein VEL07_20460 [Planctomycetota bacterium]|nr:hypothetical protein [Planctomycetota bacterium]